MLFISPSPQILLLLSACLHLLISLVVTSSVDYYSLLKVPRNAGKEEIKKSYKNLSRTYHPDKHKGKDAEEAGKKFMEIKNAYDVLMDDKKRNIYDRFGERGLKDYNEGHGQHHNPFDAFAQFFGGGEGFHQKEQEKRGPDILLDIEVDLKELYHGAPIVVDVSKQTVCNHCHGTGAENVDDVKPCASCRGQGIKIVKQMFGPGMFQHMQTPCDVCGGHGKVIKSKCLACNGNKVKRGSDQLTVVIEKGTLDGEQIGFSGEGDEHPDFYAGDVIFTVKQKPHPVFVRRGDDLYTEETITLLEALTGFDREINHLSGEKVKLNRKEVTQPGFVQVLENAGMLRHNNIGEMGKLYIKYTVVFPTSLDEGKKKELKRILS